MAGQPPSISRRSTFEIDKPPAWSTSTWRPYRWGDDTYRLEPPPARSRAQPPGGSNPSARGFTHPSPSTGAVLVVEDDQLTRRVLQELLESEGYTVHAVADGAAALAHLESRSIDVIVLDRGLPGGRAGSLPPGAGGSAGKRLRIIMLTGLDEPEHILGGFDAGADDYVTKPYSGSELLARVKANLRRTDLGRVERLPSLVVDERLQIDFNEQQVVVDGQRIGLGRTESALLRVLVENAGQVVPFATILAQVWGPAYTDAPHYVHLYVTYLRRKIERDPHNPRYILSQRRVGYRFASGGGPRATRGWGTDAWSYRSCLKPGSPAGSSERRSTSAAPCAAFRSSGVRARALLSAAQTRTRQDRALLSLLAARRAILRAQTMASGTEHGSTLQRHLAQLDALIQIVEQECSETEARRMAPLAR